MQVTGNKTGYHAVPSANAVYHFAFWGANAVHRIGTPKGKVVNSVGAGDSMVAGFIAGYLQSGSYSYALRLGTACGSATAFSLGLAERRDIDALLKTIE